MALQRKYAVARSVTGRGFRDALAVLFLSNLVACIAIPYPKKSTIKDEQLVPITKGTSTRSDVMAALGEPTIIWKTERVWVYEGGPSGGILWIVGAGGGGGIFWSDLGDDVVIMRFDEDGRIERLERRVGPLFQSDYGNFLRDWLAEPGKEANSSVRP